MQPITLRNPETGIDKTFQIPTDYHELTQDEFMGAVAIMNQTIDRPELQWALIGLIMKIPVPLFSQLAPEQRVQLLQEINFLHDRDKFPSSWMIPSFATLQYKSMYVPRKVARTFSTTLYGPGDVLGNLRFSEFMAAELRFEAHTRVPGESVKLNEFCGILFRKSTRELLKHKDKRVPYQESLIEENAKVFQTVSGDVKAAIVINYQGAKNMFPKLYTNLFPPHLQNTDTEEPTGGKQQKRAQSLGWLKMLTAMVDRDVTKLETTKQASLHTVLNTLDEILLHDRKMRDEADKLRRK